MSKQYLAIITIPDDKTFDDLVDADWSGLPNWLEGFRLSTATTRTVPERKLP